MQTPEGVAIATWVQSGAVLVSLIFIGYQVQQQTSLSRAANVQTSVGLITPLNLKLAEPDMAKIWREGSEGFKKGVPANPDDGSLGEVISFSPPPKSMGAKTGRSTAYRSTCRERMAVFASSRVTPKEYWS